MASSSILFVQAALRVAALRVQLVEVFGRNKKLEAPRSQLFRLLEVANQFEHSRGREIARTSFSFEEDRRDVPDDGRIDVQVFGQKLRELAVSGVDDLSGFGIVPTLTHSSAQ